MSAAPIEAHNPAWVSEEETRDAAAVAIVPSAPTATPISTELLSLMQHEALIAKQTKRGCMRNCCGCDAALEIKIASSANKKENIYYAREKSNCCCRICCAAHHPFTMELSQGDKADAGPMVAKFHRPCKCMLAPCKCCCFQRIEAYDMQEQHIGTMRETCWMCMPQFAVETPEGKREYLIKQPTCCCGMCINTCAESLCGCCDCRVPFFIYSRDGADKGDQVGKVVKVWSGLGAEFLGLNKFELEFPKEADALSKARLVGSMFLLNELFFRLSEADEE